MRCAIGLTGVARSGKDTVGKIMSQRGFVRVGFADKVREAYAALNPSIFIPFDWVWRWGPRYWFRPVRMPVAQAVACFGWEKLKELPEVRTGLQRMGTEVGRNMFGEDIWIRLALEEASKHDLVVFTDVRFDNEAEAILSLPNSEVWKIDRGLSPVNGHSSEAGVREELISYRIDNRSSLLMLGAAVDNHCDALLMHCGGNGDSMTDF